MEAISKTKKFLTVGTTVGMLALSGLMALSIVGDIAPQGTKQDSNSINIFADIKNGIDTIAYNSFNVAITQSTESYRHNVMEHLMKGRGAAYGFYIYTSDTEKKISSNNLEEATKLGIFKDKEAFDAEVNLLKAAAKKDIPNDRLLVQDNGVIDITDPSHFQGVNNIDQAKRKINATLTNLKNTEDTQKNNKFNM